jgi:hypothetical protein
MTTTAIIVEMLIIGFFAFIWLLLLIIRIAILDTSDFNYLFYKFDGWATPLTLFAIAFFYQLGLLVNWMSGLLVKIIYEKKLRNSIFEKDNLQYRPVKIVVDQLGSSEIHRVLRDDVSIVRLSRAGVVNFLFIAILLFSFNQIIIGLIVILFSILCFFQWHTRYVRYYLRILEAYKTILAASTKK